MDEKDIKSFNKLKKRFIEIKNQGLIKSLTPNITSVGNTFEKAIGIQINNLEFPDYMGIEIKTKLSYKNNYMTLFNATPDNYLFQIKSIINSYGYPCKNSPHYKAFQISINSTTEHKLYNGYFFQIRIDRKEKKVIVIVRNKKKNIIDTDISWSFDLLKEKYYRKLKLLLLVYADKYFVNGELFFQYKKAYFYKFKNFECFLDAIEKGDIRITFKISTFKSGRRIGQIHDHGTGFDINTEKIKSIFDTLEVL